MVAPPARPTHLMVRLLDGTVAETNHLPSAVRAAVGRAVAGGLGTPDRRGRRPVAGGVVAEVVAGTTRHSAVRFVPGCGE